MLLWHTPDCIHQFILHSLFFHHFFSPGTEFSGIEGVKGLKLILLQTFCAQVCIHRSPSSQIHTVKCATWMDSGVLNCISNIKGHTHTRLSSNYGFSQLPSAIYSEYRCIKLCSRSCACSSSKWQRASNSICKFCVDTHTEEMVYIWQRTVGHCFSQTLFEL